MKIFILVPNLVLYAFLSVLLGKMKDLYRRMEFRLVFTHRQAGPPQTAPCGLLKLSVSISLPQSSLLTHRCWKKSQGKHIITVGVVSLLEHFETGLSEDRVSVAVPLRPNHFRLEIAYDFSELSERRGESTKMTENSHAFGLTTGINLERTGVLT